jgi:hypothetical protein
MERLLPQRRRRRDCEEDPFMKLESSLIPGISNDVTLAEISTRLPRQTMTTLSMVGPLWQQAIGDRLVHDARVLAGSGERFVIFSDTECVFKLRDQVSEEEADPRVPAIYLHSLEDHTYEKLPPIPGLKSGFPFNCETVVLDGRLYVLGGMDQRTLDREHRGSKDVYVLDLAANGQWKQCAKMQEAPIVLGCLVNSGKIYAFGDRFGKNSVKASEVYDPKDNSWSYTAPIPAVLNHGRVHNVYPDGIGPCALYNVSSPGGEELIVLSGVDSLVGYHPKTDTWTRVSQKSAVTSGAMEGTTFAARGKLYSLLTDGSITVYNIDSNSWTTCYSPAAGCFDINYPVHAVYLDTEILALVRKQMKGFQCVVRSRGFGANLDTIVWEEIPASFLRSDWLPAMNFIRL